MWGRAMGADVDRGSKRVAFAMRRRRSAELVLCVCVSDGRLTRPLPPLFARRFRDGPACRNLGDLLSPHVEVVVELQGGRMWPKAGWPGSGQKQGKQTRKDVEVGG